MSKEAAPQTQPEREVLVINETNYYLDTASEEVRTAIAQSQQIRAQSDSLEVEKRNLNYALRYLNDFIVAQTETMEQVPAELVENVATAPATT